MQHLLFIDVETTGLDPKKNDILEIALAVVINEKIEKEFCYRVRPPTREKEVIVFQSAQGNNLEYNKHDLVPVKLSDKNENIIRIYADDLKHLKKFKICEGPGRFVHEIDGYYTKTKNKKYTGQIQEQALKVNNIKQHEIKNFDNPNTVINQIKKQLSPYYQRSELIVCGHNIINFDLPFIEQWLLRCDNNNLEGYFLNRRNIDTLLLARYMSSEKIIEVKGHSLGRLCKYYGIHNERAHTALSDVRANIELYFKLKDSIIKWGRDKSFKQLSML